MKKINKFTIGLVLLLTALQVKGDGTNINKPCISLETSNFDVIGDSRAEGFWGERKIKETKDGITREDNGLVTANIGGKFIFPDGTINVGNRATSGSQSSGWLDKVNACKSHNQSFVVANRSMVMMGGNDILSYHKEKSKYKEQFNIAFPVNPISLVSVLVEVYTARFKALRKLSLNSFITRPLRSFQVLLDNFLVFVNPTLALQYELGKVATRSVLKGKPKFTLNFASFWDWQTNTRTDTIVTNTNIVLRHILNQSPDHRVIMNTEYPVALRALVLSKINNDPKEYPGLLKLFSDLRLKFRQKLFPPLMKDYPGRAMPLDLYDQFMQDILAGPRPGSYFDGDSGELSLDGIHPSKNGNKFWGQQMASLMARLQWFPTNDKVDLSRSVFYGDAELDTSSSVIDIEAMAQGISDADILKASLVKIPSGYKKNFLSHDMSIYNKKGDNSAYPVSGLHRVRYKQEGETGGRLGFPTGGMYGENFDTIASQNFECGKIYDNHLDAVEHFHTEINSNECPTPEVE